MVYFYLRVRAGIVDHGRDTFHTEQMFLLMPELGGNSKDAFGFFSPQNSILHN